MTAHQLRQLLQRCVLNISTSGQHGTGFFVAPRLILTCAHVVESESNSIINVFCKEHGKTYTAVTEKLIGDPIDLALLRIDVQELNHSCVYFDQYTPQLHEELYTYGFPEQYLDGDSATFRYEGESYKGETLIYKLKQGEADSGLSGSPILNIRTGGICGIVSLSRKLGTDLGARATPISVILQSFPTLKEQQQEFHKDNQIWLDLLPIK